MCNITWQIRCSHIFLLGVFFILGLSACSKSDTPEIKTPRIEKQAYIEKGDLEDIRKHSKLRILVFKGDQEVEKNNNLDILIASELEVASVFSQSLNLEPVLVIVEQFEEMIPALKEGRGDIIASNLNATKARKEEIAFTVPVDYTDEVIITRASDTTLKSPKQLNGRQLTVHKSSSFWETAQRLKKQYPKLNVVAAPETQSDSERIKALINNDIDLTIVDRNLFSTLKEQYNDIRLAFSVSAEQAIAWGVRKESKILKEALDRFLNQERLVKNSSKRYTSDLPAITEREVIRVVTRNNAANYFIWRGELLGFEYELINEFARKQGLRLSVIVAPDHDSILPMLLSGEADIAAASLTPTESRSDIGVKFSRPYNHVSEIVVSRKDDKEANTIEELNDRTFYIRKSSSYYQTLNNLIQQGAKFKIKFAPEDEETEIIIGKVAKGEYDLTLADSHIVDIELTWRDDIKGLLSIGDLVPHGWAVRAENEVLLNEIDNFIKKKYRGLFYNITYKKYFKNKRNIKKHKNERIDLNAESDLSPYDETVKKHAQQFGFDWRLVISQMYQESRFDPTAASWAGAKGLMQVLPRTAKQMGIEGDLKDPNVGIYAGILYLEWVRDRFEEHLPIKDRMWFSLAGYNAGFGHVNDARRLAKKMNWDHNRWFGHVEKAMLLLSQKKYYKSARYGYVRGKEPVDYVRQIRERYNAYIRLKELA